MSCYSCGGNPNTFCGECVNSRDTWITPVDALPDVFMGDFDHLFRTPDGNFYALSPDRSEWLRINGQGTSYKAGDGISITNDNVISSKVIAKNQTLSLENNTLKISDGNSVVLPLNDSNGIKERVVKLEHEEYREKTASQYPYDTSSSNVVGNLIRITPNTLFNDGSGNNYYGVNNDGTVPVSDIGVSLLEFDCTFEVKPKDSPTSHTYTKVNNRIIKLDITKESISNNYEYPLDNGVSIRFVYTTDWNNQGKCSIHIEAYLIYNEVIDYKVTQYIHKLSKGEIDSMEQARIPLKVGSDEKGFIIFNITNIRFSMFAYGRTLSKKNPYPSNGYSRLDTV